MPIIVEPTPTPAELAAQAIDTPHFAYPFTFTSGTNGGRAVVVQQGTVDEVSSCVANIATCDQGFRTDLPDFGIPDPTFSTLPLNTAVLGDAITKYEPRASLTITAAGDPVAPQDQTVTVYVQIASPS